MRNSNWSGAGVALIVASVAALAACSPAKEAEPRAQQESDALPKAGEVDKGAFSTGSWVTATLSVSSNGAAPMRLCHVSPAINYDLSLAVVVEESGETQVGVARVPSDGKSKPLGDVELQVDSAAPHVIHATAMSPAALAVWPPGTATLVAGTEAKAILSEVEKGATVQIKESGSAATRSFPTEGLSQAIADCSKP